jgi:4-hydroxy-3-polyprenylbenzoate decarboxylase
MGYKNLAECVADLEKHGHLIRIKEEVDPYLEMAAIHFACLRKTRSGFAIRKCKGSKFKAVSNLFGTLERAKFMFRDSLANVEQLVALRV